MSHPILPPAPLPARPNLEQLRKQAKDLARAMQAGDPVADARVRRLLPELEGRLPLTQAQFIVAREYGFPSWPKLVEYVQRLTAAPQAQRPFVTDLEYFEGRAKGLLTTVKDGLHTSLSQVRHFHPKYANASDEAIQTAKLTLADGRLILAREHGFNSWRSLTAHLEYLRSGGSEPFVTAFEALKSGDFAAFSLALKQDASLVNASGTNGNTLLSLAGSFRRLEATKELLALGADPNLGNRYGWTPLHQAAYSNQIDFAKVLLEAGASPQLSARGEGGTPLVQALFWGRRELSDFLASYGVFPNNLRAAAGLGRLDLLETFFNPDGTLKPEAGRAREFYRPHGGFLESTLSDAPQEILDEAFVYAAKCGRLEAMKFLLQHGAQVDGEPYNGTAMTWAIQAGQGEAVDWLLQQGAKINNICNFGGERGLTPLHIAAWAGQESIARHLVAAGAGLTIQDPRYHGTPAGWAEYNGHPEVAQYLKSLT